MAPLSPLLSYVVLTAEILTAIPTAFTLKRIGFSPWWALVCFIPFLALAALWALAFIRWPRDAQPQP